MKCLILAGGAGERLWPLSRRNYPKQFIELTQYHSVFQDTIARNMPYCDEFLITAGSEHRYVIEDQLRAFQGLACRFLLEEARRGTCASVTLALMSLEPSEYVFVTSSDMMIDASSGYSDTILEAMNRASEGKIAVFGMEDDDKNSRYGYIYGEPARFVEKPGDLSVIPDASYRNLGMILARAGDLLNEIRRLSPEIFDACSATFSHRVENGGDLEFPACYMERIKKVSVEREILQKTGKLSLVRAGYEWSELTSLEDLEGYSYKNSGPAVACNSDSSLVVNRSESRAVIVSGLEDAIVVNTDDAVYVGRRGSDADLKKLIGDTQGEAAKVERFIDKSPVHFRQWGYYREIESSPRHYVRHIYIRPGRTIYEHSHESRTENWIILAGQAIVTLDGKSLVYDGGGNIEVKPKVRHQISNAGDVMLEFVDTAYGDDIFYDDRQERSSEDIGELELGVRIDPILKLRPAFKEYLWGGRRLKSEFGMKTDMDMVAEAWVLSAHPDGQTRVVNGRHKGMYLGRFIDVAGRSCLGWKCASLKAFPLLVKLIDAQDDLSVQVHPDDDYALVHENSYGKNEMWYVMDSLPGSGLYVGFKRDVTREEVKEAVENKTITELLNFVPTRTGDVFFIPAGTVHAIGAGNLICEVQQSSNCTYRLYDYDRVDRYGNRRELHLEKALDVMDYGKYVPQDLGGVGSAVCRCKYFEVLVYDVDGEQTVPADDSKFDAVVCLEGHGRISCGSGDVSLAPGESAFLPASKDPIVLSGRMKILLCHV